VSRDYKRRAEPRAARHSRPGWVPLLVGFALGVATTGFAWVKLGPAELRALGESVQQIGQRPQPAARTEKETAAAAVPKPRFDFYNVLPEMEVVVTDEEVERRSKHGTPAPGAPVVPAVVSQPAALSPAPAAPAPATDETLLLQVGAFKRSADADKLKAQLALLGIEAQVQNVTIDNKDAFYRVRVGPYRNVAKLKEVKDRLKQGGIEGVVVRLK
jgi:cell division protein FtsN